MLSKIMILSFILVFLTSCSDSAKKIGMLDWHEQESPTKENSQPFGFYTAGCLNGAVELPKQGVGYKNFGILNDRNFGHKSLVDLVQNISEYAHKQHGKNLIIGDLSHARGGPASLETSAHRSHQNGLDVDIWYKIVNEYYQISKKTRAQNVLTHSGKYISSKYWSNINDDVLKQMANYDEVERILVNPAVKKQLCTKYNNAQWLSKIRAWWGHNKHFHVRLKCPKGESFCKKQSPAPKAHGCGAQLDWWFSDEAIKKGKEKSQTKRKYPKLPLQCKRVFYY